MQPVEQEFEHLEDARYGHGEKEQSEPLRLGVAQILHDRAIESRGDRAIDALDQDRGRALPKTATNRDAEKNRGAQDNAQNRALPVPQKEDALGATEKTGKHFREYGASGGNSFARLGG